MNKFRLNEQGYALVIVLLTIVLIGIITPPLISSVLNSANQTNLSEERIHLNNLADMGVTYFDSNVRKLVEVEGATLKTTIDNLEQQIELDPENREFYTNQKNTKIKQTLEGIRTNLESTFSTPVSIDDIKGYKFNLSKNSAKIEGNNKLILDYTSESVSSESGNPVQRQIKAIIQFNDANNTLDYQLNGATKSVTATTEPQAGNSENPDSETNENPAPENHFGDDFDTDCPDTAKENNRYIGNCIYQSEYLIDHGDRLFIEGDVIFKKSLTINNGGTVDIKGKVNFEEELIIEGQGSKLEIEGEACFNGGEIDGNKVVVNGKTITNFTGCHK